MEVISIKDHYNKNTAKTTKMQTHLKKNAVCSDIAGEIFVMEFNTYFRIEKKEM